MMNLTPYSTALPLMGPLPTWLGKEDAQRLEAYTLYEAMYRNTGEAFKLLVRGENSRPIHLPSARTIIEAKKRFLAHQWTFAMAPDFGTTADRELLTGVLTSLFRRERVWSKFDTQCRYGMVRGDSVWHIVADEEKPEGKRISVMEVDPGSYFPIVDEFSGRVLGVHLVDQVVSASGEVIIKRQTYRKGELPGDPITYDLSWWKAGAWDDREDGGELKPADRALIPEGETNQPQTYELDARITALPVYHVRNNPLPGEHFGVSELSGYETLMRSSNQTISDEDLALALDGLGLYFTNSGPPIDEDGNETTWKLGPGTVVEGDEKSTFSRVSGVHSVEPSQSHIDFLLRQAREASGVPDVAVGKVDTGIAESGVALAFHMGPLLASNAEKEREILSVTDHMLYDLTTMWLPVFEAFESPARPVSIVGDPMPVNRKAVIEEVLALMNAEPPLISAEYARTILSEKLGYDFPDEMANAVVEDATAMALARNQDPFASRVAAELSEES